MHPLETREYNFPREVCVFPLAGSLLFPDAVQALYVFEGRYLEMVEECLKSPDKLIAMAVLKPGFDTDYYDRPEVFETACLGQIMNYKKLPNGHIHMAVKGLEEIRLKEEVELENSFRTFSIEESFFGLDLEASQEVSLRAEIYELLRKFFEIAAQGQASPEEVCDELDFLALVNNLSFILPFSIENKLKLFQVNRLSQRTFLLQTYLEQALARQNKDPQSASKPSVDPSMLN